jgi:cobalt/nickel transport system permease protein
MLRSDVLPLPSSLHIPDGFLSLGVSLICWLLAISSVAFALWRSREELGERQVPMMGVLAAFIFAAQMLNFPVAGGTSGHLVGGALAAILLGPWAGILTMTTVVAIQALLFQDGGLLVMGANIANMAVISTLVAYGVYRGVVLLLGDQRRGALIGGMSGAWASVVISAVAAAIELGFSGTSAIGLALPAMAGVHILIGVGEGLITVGALALVTRVRPDLVAGREVGMGVGLRWTAVGLVVALTLTLLSPLASPSPDGLERVAESLGFIETAQEAPYEVMPDYLFPGISNEALATIAAGMAGTILVFGIVVGLAALFRRRSLEGVTP